MFFAGFFRHFPRHFCRYHLRYFLQALFSGTFQIFFRFLQVFFQAFSQCFCRYHLRFFQVFFQAFFQARFQVFFKVQIDFLWRSTNVLSWQCHLGLEFPFIYYCRYFPLEVFPLAKHCGIGSRGNHQWVYHFSDFLHDSSGCWTWFLGLLYL